MTVGILNYFIFLIPIKNNYILIGILTIITIFLGLLTLIKDMFAKKNEINSKQSKLWKDLNTSFISFIFVNVVSTVMYFKNFDLIGQNTLYKFVLNNKIEK